MKTELPVREKSARNEGVNHFYNVRFIYTVPVLFALQVITYLLTHSVSRFLPEKLTGFQLVKKFSAFTEPEVLLPESEVPATPPYPEPARSHQSISPGIRFTL